MTTAISAPAGPPTGTSPTTTFWLRVLAIGAALYLAFTVVRLAWLCDDAYITFRTVENAAAGHGLRWNVAERVQTYTHPLWMLLLLAGRLLSGELYYTALALGGVCTLATCLLFARHAGRAAVIATSLLVLASSRAFTCYATSGLENSLVFALLALFVGTYLGDHGERQRARRRLFWLSLWGALLATTRLDMAVLVGPALVAAAWPLRWRAALVPVALGFLPLVLWLLFATAYYGTPWPSTAYAKALAVDIPRSWFLRHGALYLLDAVLRDPTTAATLLGCLLLAATKWAHGQRAVLLGCGLYLGYVLWIGGDFMATRFLAAPLVAAWFVGTAWLRRANGRTLALVAGAAFGLSLLPGVPDAWRSAPVDPMARVRGQIADERAFYVEQEGLGLWSERPRPQFASIEPMLAALGVQGTAIDVRGNIGVHGYTAGPRVHLVDPWLCDPLLMRLPTIDREHWRVGHYTRRIPEGYLEALATGDDRGMHPALRDYHAHLQRVVRAPLCDGERLASLWFLLSGGGHELLQRYVAEQYRQPPRREVAAASLHTPTARPAHWFQTPCVLVADGGVRIRWPSEQRGSAVVLELDGGDWYRVQLRAGDRVVFSTTVTTGSAPFQGLSPQRVELPAGGLAFDAIDVDRAADPAAAPDRTRADLEDTFLTLQLTPGTSLDHVWALAGVRVE